MNRFACCSRLLMSGVVAITVAMATTGMGTPIRADERTTPCSTPRELCADLTVRLRGVPDTWAARYDRPFDVTVVVSNETNSLPAPPALVPVGAALVQYNLQLLVPGAMPVDIALAAFSAPPGYSCTAPGPAVTTGTCTATRPDAIPSGHDRVFSFSFVPFPQPSSIFGASRVTPGTTLGSRAVADPGNVIAEGDETNNAAAATTAVTAPAFVIREECLPSDFHLRQGTAWSCNVRVINRPDATADAVIPTGTILFRFKLESLDLTHIGLPSGVACDVVTDTDALPDRCLTTQPLVIPIGGEVDVQVDMIVNGPRDGASLSITLEGRFQFPGTPFRPAVLTLLLPRSPLDDGNVTGGIVDF